MVANSFLFATGSTLVALALGGVAAFLVERTNIAFKKTAYVLMLIPLIMPGALKASAWVLLLNPNNGVLNQLWFSLGFKSYLFNDKSVLSMVWVQGISMIPVTFLLLGAAFKMMDPALEEASYAAGAGKIGTLRRITIRLMVPAIAAAGLLNFTRALESFDISHIQGAENVAGMVVCENGRMNRSEYRKFKIRGVAGSNDVASMRETVFRRYRRMLDEGKPLPDLILIDGGKGQLGGAAEAMRELDLEAIPMVGVVKPPLRHGDVSHRQRHRFARHAFCHSRDELCRRGCPPRVARLPPEH